MYQGGSVANRSDFEERIELRILELFKGNGFLICQIYNEIRQNLNLKLREIGC